MNRIFRILTAMIIVSALGISLSYAETIWERRQKAINPEAQPKVEQKAEEITEPADTYSYDYDEEDAIIPAKQTTLDPANPFNITVPAMYGTIIDSYKGTNGKLIVHIQDAHANYEAQKNIAAIIETLINSYNINLVLMEGKATDRDFKYLRYRAPLDVRKDIADNLLKEGIFNGVNYLDLASSYPLLIQGVEDKNLYDINGAALWDMDRFKDLALEYVTKLMSATDSIKEKVYNPDLLKLDKAKKDYEDESVDLLGYYKILYDSAIKKNVAIGEFRNFAALIKIDEMEQTIDTAKISNGTATDEQNKTYGEYQAALKDLNINKLFGEEPLVESKIQQALSENSDQRELYKIFKAISITEKMLAIKIVPEEYNYFLENKKDFDAQSWADFLREKSVELGLSLDIPENFYIINDNRSSIEKFYSSAVDREEAFLKKSKVRMDKDNISSAILIAGGFHTPTLTKLLNDSGYSYIVISPRVATKTDDNLYRETLKRQWAPGIE